MSTPLSLLTPAQLLEVLQFVPVPAGHLTMGLEAVVYERLVKSYGEAWIEFFGREVPQHRVPVTAFSLMRYPVTNAQYAQFMADGGYSNSDYWTPEGWAWRLARDRHQPLQWGKARFTGEALPVAGVSWFEAMAFAKWAALRTHENLRLPTEAEWEWAARGENVKTQYPWNGMWDVNKLNSSSQNHGPTPVGQFSPQGDGPFGHGDLLGQVWEWTSSQFRPYPYVETDGREDVYATAEHTMRGGNWSDGKYYNRISARYYFPGNYSESTIGLRLAKDGSRPAIPDRSAHDLLVYGRTSFCPDLVKTKAWLHAWNVPYRQINVDIDEDAAYRLDSWLGSRTVPTLVIAERNSVEPITPPADVDLTHLRNADRGSMLHEPEEATLREFLVRHGILAE